MIHCSIPFAADGVSIEQTWDTMGMRATGSQTVRIDGAFHVTIDSEDRVPDLVIELVKRGVRPMRVEPLTPTLEDLYFEMQRAHRETV